MKSYKQKLAGQEEAVKEDVRLWGALGGAVTEKYQARDVVAWLRYIEGLFGEESFPLITDLGTSTLEKLADELILAWARTIARLEKENAELRQRVLRAENAHERQKQETTQAMRELMKRSLA